MELGGPLSPEAPGSLPTLPQVKTSPAYVHGRPCIYSAFNPVLHHNVLESTLKSHTICVVSVPLHMIQYMWSLTILIKVQVHESKVFHILHSPPPKRLPNKQIVKKNL